MTPTRAAELAETLSMIIIEVSQTTNIPISSDVIEFMESLEMLSSSVDNKQNF